MMPTFLKQFSKPSIILMAVAALLRFWNLPELLHFTLDEELEAFIVRNIVTGFHYPAIGVSVAPVGLHLSPLFYYLAAIPFALGNLDPLAWGITACLLGILTTAMIYLFTTKMFHQRIALFATLLYSCSFLIVMYDKHFWNVTPVMFVSVVTVFSLYQIIHKQYLWMIPLGLALSLGLSSHLSTVSLLLLTMVVFIRDKVSLKNRYFVIGSVIVLLSQSPLLVFELRHNFQQSQVLLSFLTGEHSTLDIQRISDNLLLLPKLFSRFLYVFGEHDLAREHSYGWIELAARDKRIPLLLITVVVGIFMTYVLVVLRNMKNHALKLHLAFLLIGALSLVFYGLLFKGSLFEFYLLILVPTFCVVVAVILDVLWRRSTLTRNLVIGGLIVFFGVNSYAALTATHSYGYAQKRALISWSATQVGDKPYELHSIGVDHKFEGYRYLYERFFKAPEKSYADAQLGWLYQQPVASESVKIRVIISSTEPGHQPEIDQEGSHYSPNKILEKEFGEIKVVLTP